MSFTHRRVDPEADVDLIYGWVTQPRAKFWGMTDHTRQQVGDTYRLIDSLDTHHAYLLLEDDTPVVLFQTYQPEHDPVGESYDWQPGDLGGHLFLGPTDDPRSGFTLEVLAYILNLIFADPEVKRLVGEPDHLNTKSVELASRFSTSQGQIDLGHKTAELFFLTRAEWEESFGAADTSA